MCIGFDGALAKPDQPVPLDNLRKPNCPGAENLRAFSLLSPLGIGYHALMLSGTNFARQEKSKRRWLERHDRARPQINRVCAWCWFAGGSLLAIACLHGVSIDRLGGGGPRHHRVGRCPAHRHPRPAPAPQASAAAGRDNPARRQGEGRAPAADIRP